MDGRAARLPSLLYQECPQILGTLLQEPTPRDLLHPIENPDCSCLGTSTWLRNFCHQPHRGRPHLSSTQTYSAPQTLQMSLLKAVWPEKLGLTGDTVEMPTLLGSDFILF